MLLHSPAPLPYFPVKPGEIVVGAGSWGAEKSVGCWEPSWLHPSGEGREREAEAPGADTGFPLLLLHWHVQSS